MAAIAVALVAGYLYAQWAVAIAAALLVLGLAIAARLSGAKGWLVGLATVSAALLISGAVRLSWPPFPAP